MKDFDPIQESQRLNARDVRKEINKQMASVLTKRKLKVHASSDAIRYLCKTTRYLTDIKGKLKEVKQDVDRFWGNEWLDRGDIVYIHDVGEDNVRAVLPPRF